MSRVGTVFPPKEGQNASAFNSACLAIEHKTAGGHTHTRVTLLMPGIVFGRPGVPGMALRSVALKTARDHPSLRAWSCGLNHGNSSGMLQVGFRLPEATDVLAFSVAVGPAVLEGTGASGRQWGRSVAPLNAALPWR